MTETETKTKLSSNGFAFIDINNSLILNCIMTGSKPPTFEQYEQAVYHSYYTNGFKGRDLEKFQEFKDNPFPFYKGLIDTVEATKEHLDAIGHKGLLRL